MKSSPSKEVPSSISRPSVSVLPYLMQHLAFSPISTWLSSQTTSILSSSSIRFQHFLHSTGCSFRLLTVFSLKGLILECSMSLVSTMRLLMHYLASRMISSLSPILSLSFCLFNPLDLRWGQLGYEPQAILKGQATCQGCLVHGVSYC